MIRLTIDENFLKTFEKVTFFLLIVLSLFYYMISANLLDLLSVFIGGILALLHFRTVKKNVQAVLQAVASGNQTVQGAKRIYLFKYYLLLIATAFILFFVIKAQIVRILPLLVGISVVTVNILLCFLREVGRNFWLKFKEG